MISPLRATSPEETERVRAFLADVFRIGLDAPALEPACVNWRFHEPRPDWPGSRSYVLERGGAYVAHGCVWPMPLVRDGESFAACQIVDWAGARNFPGAGLLLRREVEEMVDVSVAVGGSEDSRQVMPLAGYATPYQFQRFVRVVRPFRQMLTRRDGSRWKRAAKAPRNLVSSVSAMPKLAAGWEVVPATRGFTAEVAVGFMETGWVGTQRSPELIDFLVRCPAATVTAWLVSRRGKTSGYFLLSEVHGQTRIADLQVSGAAPEDWLSVVAVATRTAAALPDTCEIVADTTLPVFAEALRHAGFRAAGEQPVFVHDLKERMAGRQLHLNPVDYDAFFGWYPGGHFSG